MARRGNSRADIFAVQSDCEEESAIETVLTDAEEDWTAVTPEPRRPRVQSRRQKSALRERHKRRTRDDVPWDHHEKHRHTRAPVGISEKIERRLAEKEKMKDASRSRSLPRKPAVVYDEDEDESFLSSYENGGGGGEEGTAVTSISQLRRELKRMAMIKASNGKKTSKTKSKKKKSGTKSKDDKRKKKSKRSSRRRSKKRGNGDAFEQLFKACDTSGGAVYGAACKMVDKAFQLDSSSDEDSSSDDDSSSGDEDTMAASTAVSSAETGADNTAITGVTEATSAVPSFDTTKHSGTTATGYTGITEATGYTEEIPAPIPRRTPRRREAAGSKRSPPASTPTTSRRKPIPTPPTPHKKSGGHRYRQVIAPPGKLGLSLTSSPRGPLVKMVSRHCPVNVKVGDVIARVNGQSVLGMEVKRVMDMFVTLANREKVIDILPQSGSGGIPPNGAVGKPRPPTAPPSRPPGQHRHSPRMQTMRSMSTPRAAAPSRSRSRSQRRY